jgi:hypothetical protein
LDILHLAAPCRNVPVTSALGLTVNVDTLLQAAVYAADLDVVHSHFEEVGIKDLKGMLHLKSALITLANVRDFESTIRPSYQDRPEPSGVYKPLRKNFEFAKYLRNKFVGHLHPELLSKALEWQPMLRRLAADVHDPQVMTLANLWILETAINTYVGDDGKHKVFGGETDLMYPPDWTRFVEFLHASVTGGIQYLKAVHDQWAPQVFPAEEEPFSLELALKAGRTKFKFLGQ